MTGWPIPNPFCQHNWVSIGDKYASWSSSNTADNSPPKGCVVYQPSECSKCLGRESIPVDTVK